MMNPSLLCRFLGSYVLLSNTATNAHVLYRHEAVKAAPIEERQWTQQFEAITIIPEKITTATHYVYGYFTPSPSATPIPITQQSQVETSFIPQITMCVLPPIAFFEGSFVNTNTMGSPYLNYSMSIPDVPGTCTTVYTSTSTTLCATVLSGLISRETVSDCDQTITFSSQYGYWLETPSRAQNWPMDTITPMLTIHTLITYYMAPWQELTTAAPPTDVSAKICDKPMDGTQTCVSQREVWEVQMVTLTSVYASEIDLTTRLPGPATFLIETFHLELTKTVTTITLSTTLYLNYEVEQVSISRSTITPTTIVPSVSINMILLPANHITGPNPTQTRTRMMLWNSTVTLPPTQGVNPNGLNYMPP
ncbi:hypothetical protein M501DRAFT_1057462 [Patellaria atrata CBS 101060]|uniref:Uncharacterized protein n=1 Tax=Patellaria atrata CBS 101060 TaxID=1346257 RepID=A0A9P4VMY8_9PEZI|nr:hypothetical protein M501DRAFT_1057462 [Patellaria atrata CBS 101060]